MKDKLIQAIYYEGCVLLFMESGKIYKMVINNYNTNKMEFMLIGEIPNE